jgi:hypothetical protein
MDAVSAFPPPIERARLRGVAVIAWVMILGGVSLGLLSLLLTFVSPLSHRPSGKTTPADLRFVAFLSAYF